MWMSRPTIASIEESAPAEDPDQSGFVSELDCVHANVARRGDVSDRVVDVEDPFDRMAQPTTEDIEGLTSDLATPSSPKTTHARGEGRHLGALAPERPYPAASSRRAPDARHGASNRRPWTHHDPSLIPPTVGRLESGLGRRRHRERATATHQESGPRRLRRRSRCAQPVAHRERRIALTAAGRASAAALHPVFIAGPARPHAAGIGAQLPTSLAGTARC